MRTKAREVVFQVLFASSFIGEVDNGLKNALCKNEKLDGNDLEYIEGILKSVGEHKSEFEEIIDRYSISFPSARIYPADKNILFVALAEIKYMDDIPPAVSANEAANIASKYSSEKSASYVSGILSEVIKQNL
ncbi:MAG: transcription antitermination factor NusB [Clostridiales bacterium]|nr:transcription antitermination factor NusB [Clostridiales bacterium]